jgi:hypothetical protein
MQLKNLYQLCVDRFVINKKMSILNGNVTIKNEKFIWLFLYLFLLGSGLLNYAY